MANPAPIARPHRNTGDQRRYREERDARQRTHATTAAAIEGIGVGVGRRMSQFAATRPTRHGPGGW
jgi:hypothetical protein